MKKLTKGLLTTLFTLGCFIVTYGDWNTDYTILIQHDFLAPWSFSELCSSVLYVLNHGSYNHIFGNMLIFCLLAPWVELKYGCKKFLGLLVFSWLITTAATLCYYNGTAASFVGASGIVFALIGVVCGGRIFGLAKLAILLMVALTLFNQITGFAGFSYINHMAHLSGFVAGLIFELRWGVIRPG